MKITYKQPLIGLLLSCCLLNCNPVKKTGGIEKVKQDPNFLLKIAW